MEQHFLIRKAALNFAMTPEMFNDEQARDWFVASTYRRLMIYLTNEGCKPFGRPTLHWRRPDMLESWRDPFMLHGIVLQRGIMVTPIGPEEWDVYDKEFQCQSGNNLD